MPIYRACLVCGELTQGSRCPRHPRKDRWAGATRGRSYDQVKLRADLLARRPRCECTGWCRKHEGRCDQPSTIRDHILNVARGGTDAPENEQALCRRCHNVKTARESRLGRSA